MATSLSENEVLEQESKLYNAIKASDIAALDELLHDKLLFMVPGGNVITKEIDLKTYRDGALQVEELQPEVEKLNIIEELAVITLTLRLKGTFNNMPFETTCRYIRVWKKFDGVIKVVGGSGTTI